MTDDHFNGLSPAEAERLYLLAEECAETIEAVTKILRHGYESFNPCKPGPFNRETLETEIGHVLFAVDLMIRTCDLEDDQIRFAKAKKADTCKQWLHHQ